MLFIVSKILIILEVVIILIFQESGLPVYVIFHIKTYCWLMMNLSHFHMIYHKISHT